MSASPVSRTSAITPQGARFRVRSSSSANSDAYIRHPLDAAVAVSFAHTSTLCAVRPTGDGAAANGWRARPSMSHPGFPGRKFLTVRDLRRYPLARHRPGMPPHQDGPFPKCGSAQVN